MNTTVKNYSCEVCEKILKCEDIMVIHRKSVVVDEEDERNYHENEISNRTFNSPSQIDKSSSDEVFRCEICDFASAMTEIIENNKELIHHLCIQCDASFTSQKKQKTHIKNLHCDKF